jgi:hypothetical protein
MKEFKKAGVTRPFFYVGKPPLSLSPSYALPSFEEEGGETVL